MKKIRTSTVIAYIFLLIASSITVFPIFFTIINSFMSQNDVISTYGQIGQASDGLNSYAKLVLLPYPMTLDQYFQVLIRNPEILYRFWNSVILTVPILIGGVFFSSLSGYGISKFKFPGRKIIYFCYILVMLLPLQVTLVSSYIFFHDIGLIGKRAAVILPGIFSSFGAFLMYQFMNSIPDETLESARIDGASEPEVFLKIAMPQAVPGAASLIILLLIDCWNMIEQPLTLLKYDNLYPLSVSLKYINDNEMSIAFVCAVVLMIPVLLTFGIVEDNLVEGISKSIPVKVK